MSMTNTPPNTRDNSPPFTHLKRGHERERVSKAPRAAMPQLEKVGQPVQGKIKFYDSRAGFGYIQPDQGGADVYLHRSALGGIIAEMLKKGRRVAFQNYIQKDGPHAGSNWAGDLTVID